MKPFDDILKLDPESTDLYYDGFIDTHYPNRPRKLDSLCLYDFARWFSVDKIQLGPKSKIEYYKVGEYFYK